MKKQIFIATLIFSWITVYSQNAIIVVIDGARYSETFGSKEKYIPYIWNQLRPAGTIWTNFQNDGLTKTDPGHSTIETGAWQDIDNKGFGRPNQPTIFEYYRKAKNALEQTCAVIAGKKKLEILTHSNFPEYGEKYKAAFFRGSDDETVFQQILTVLPTIHPHLVLINFPSVDAAGHDDDWESYTSAIRTVDSLVYMLWLYIQHDSLYRDHTTLLVTNDHGRHDKAHGGFSAHGCSCEGCRHIMLLAIGKGFPKGRIVRQRRTQCDIAPTVGELLSFQTPYAHGKSLMADTAGSTGFIKFRQSTLYLDRQFFFARVFRDDKIIDVPTSLLDTQNIYRWLLQKN